MGPTAPSYRVAPLAALLAGCAAVTACDPPPPPRVAPIPAPPARAPVTVTILYTTDEHGWLLPLTEGGEVRGGAAEMLGQWIAREGHCPGPAILNAPPRTAAEPMPERSACSNPGTLLLSGGDNWTGPAVSSFYGGLPMAEAMARMGYAASAFGNHEFDFGRDQFTRNRARGGFPYLAANMHVSDPKLSALDIKPFVIFDRRGVKIGVIGLATDTTLTDALASHFSGIEISKEEPALDRAVKDAWSKDPDALIAVIHECPDKLKPILLRHPEWRLSFVGGGHCHRFIQDRAFDTPIIAPGWRLQSYARVRLSIDKDRPARERVLSVDPEVIQVSHREGAPPDAPPEENVAALQAAWKERLYQSLGEPIGYTQSGIKQRSAQMARWIGDTWRGALGAEIAIINDGALRQAVPKGIITQATIYSVMPFDNKLVVCTITGRDLLENLNNKEALFAGLTRLPNGSFTLLSGAPIELSQKYTVVTIDYLYAGGAGFGLRNQDPTPKETGLDWRVPVIAWMKEQQTTPESPLEERIRPP